jgi:DNA ligase 1
MVNNKILPFSDVIKKHVDDRSYCVYVFDIMQLNGQSLINKPILDRKNALSKHFANSGQFKLLNYSTLDCKSPQFIKELKEKFDHAIQLYAGPDSDYNINGSRVQWAKVKKTSKSTIGDSLDLVPIGAYHGVGRRVSQFGSFLMGVKQPNKQIFQPLCKIGTGFDEAFLQQIYKELTNNVCATMDVRVQSKIKADIWLKPCMVWEVSYGQFSKSSKYLIGDDGLGISLRFPSFVRIRRDKSIDQASDCEQVIEMYKNRQLHEKS